MVFEVLGALWNFQAGNAGNNMQGSSSTSSTSGTSSSMMIPFQIIVEDTIRPKGAIKFYKRNCELFPPVQDTNAFATCP